MIHSSALQRVHEQLNPEQLKLRLLDLWERTGEETLHRLAEGLHPHEDRPLEEGQERTDWVSTCVMDCFKKSGDSQVFSMLYELNEDAFLHAIQAKARRTATHVDPHDVLQEVFLNIFRYPHRFQSEHADAFRNWGHRIARNTLLKALRGQNRISRCASLDDQNMIDQEDSHARPPDRSALEAESAQLVDQAYLIYLNLYLLHFEQLTPKEKTALTMVEVDGASYKAVADHLGIRLENLKMVIFRGRRKVLRGMTRSLADLGLAEEADKSSLSASLPSVCNGSPEKPARLGAARACLATPPGAPTSCANSFDEHPYAT